MATELTKIMDRLTKIEAAQQQILSRLQPLHTGETTTPQQGQAPIVGVDTSDGYRRTLEFIDKIMVPSAGADPAAVKQRSENLDAVAAQFDEAYFEGMFPVERLTEQDMVYIAQKRYDYFQKYHKDLLRDGLIKGKNLHLNQIVHNGDGISKNQDRLGALDMGSYNSALKREIDRRLA